MGRVVSIDSDGNEHYPYSDWDKEPIECRECEYNHDFYKCSKCDCFIPKIGCPDGKKKKPTNADRIRAMSDEELAEFIASGVPKDVCKDRCGGDESFQCSECVLDWLKEEAEGKET